MKNLKLEFVKIDGDLIRDICSDAIDCSMVDSINSMAHLLGIKTMAENVESEAVLAKLKLLELDFAQGFHLGDLVKLDDVGSESVIRNKTGTQVN